MTMEMKKRYITPETETIDCMPGSAMLVPSLGTGTGEDGDPSTEEGSGFDGEATGAARGDWNNIWEGL